MDCCRFARTIRAKQAKAFLVLNPKLDIDDGRIRRAWIYLTEPEALNLIGAVVLLCGDPPALLRHVATLSTLRALLARLDRRPILCRLPVRLSGKEEPILLDAWADGEHHIAVDEEERV